MLFLFELTGKGCIRETGSGRALCSTSSRHHASLEAGKTADSWGYGSGCMKLWRVTTRCRRVREPRLIWLAGGTRFEGWSCRNSSGLQSHRPRIGYGVPCSLRISNLAHPWLAEVLDRVRRQFGSSIKHHSRFDMFSGIQASGKDAVLDHSLLDETFSSRVAGISVARIGASEQRIPPLWFIY